MATIKQDGQSYVVCDECQYRFFALTRKGLVLTSGEVYYFVRPPVVNVDCPRCSTTTPFAPRDAPAQEADCGRNMALRRNRLRAELQQGCKGVPALETNTTKTSKLLIPGAGHVAACYDTLQHELASRGEGDWQAVTLPPSLHRLPDAAAYLEHLYPGPKLIVAHSLGGLLAARLAELGQVLGICALAPVGEGLAGSLTAAAAAIRYLGLRQGLRMLFGGGGFPLGEPGVGRLLYADHLAAAEQARRLSRLRREPLTIRLGDALLPQRPAPAAMHNLVLAFADDRLVGKAWTNAYARWAHAELQTMPGPHNAFEDEGQAAVVADHILNWCRQAEQQRAVAAGPATVH